jgi:hypothetical protein
VLAAEHLLGLAGVYFLREIVEAPGEILGDRLTRLRPFDEHAEILGTAPQRIAEGLIVLEPAAPLQQLLRCRLILPEIGS